MLYVYKFYGNEIEKGSCTRDPRRSVLPDQEDRYHSEAP